jgi:hypothetical protein
VHVALRRREFLMSREFLRPWTRKQYKVATDWSTSPVPLAPLRLIPGHDRSGTVCAIDLTPLGTVRLPFDPHSVALNATATPDGSLDVEFFGPG